MTTRQSIAAGCYPCSNCRGEGREWHGKVDALCQRCRGMRLEPCVTPECRRPAFRGPTCRECS